MAEQTGAERKDSQTSLSGAARVLKAYTRYPSQIDRQRAQLLQVTTYVLFAVSVIGLIISFGGSESLLAISAIYLAYSLLSLVLITFGRLKLASILTILLLNIQLMMSGVAASSTIVLPLLMTITLALAGYLLGMKAVWYVAMLNTALLAAFAFLSDEISESRRILFIIQSALVQLSVGVIVRVVFKNIYSWVQRAENTTLQMETAITLSESMTRSRTLHELLQTATQKIRDTFGFQYVQVFLLDEEGVIARIESGTGEAGESMLAQGHALAVSSDTLVGLSISSGKPITSNDVSRDSRFIGVDLIEGTQSEAAVPLIINERVIGAMDFFSSEKGRFSEDLVDILSIITAQMATSIDKFDLVNQLQGRIQENEILLAETQKNLSQIEEMASRMTMESWKQYLDMRSREGFAGFRLTGGDLVPQVEWTPFMEETFHCDHPLLLKEDSSSQLAGLPLKVRGEKIGVLTVENHPSRQWTDAELELLEDIGERLATAIDNTRLYEQASLLAGRERVINQVSQDIQKATSLDEVLQSSLTELSNILGASKGIVKIHTRAEKSAPGKETDRNGEVLS